MSKPTHFHPLALVTRLFTTFKNMAFIFVIGYLNRSDFNGYFGLAVAGLVLITSGLAVVNYWFRTYEIQPDKLVIQSGVFTKQRTMIPYHKIQTIKQQQWFFLKPFDLVSLAIETASGQTEESEAQLDVVPRSVLLTIENQRRNSQAPLADSLPDQQPDAGDHPVGAPSTRAFHLTNGKIFLFSLTDLSLFATALFLLGIGDNFIPQSLIERFESEVDTVLQAGIIIIILAVFVVLLFLVAVAILRNMSRFYQFTLWREGDTLHIERGLFQRHTQSIPIAKIQGITLKQQVLRQLFHLTSVKLIMATQTGTSEETDDAFSLLPIISTKEVYQVLNQVLPEWELTEPAITSPSQELTWYFLRWPLVMGLLATGIASYFTLWLGGALLLATLFALVAGLLKAKKQGYQRQEEKLVIQTYHLFTKQQTIIPQKRIQSFERTTSKWLYPKGLGHVTYNLRSGSSVTSSGLRFLPERDHQALADFYYSSKDLP